MSKYHYFFKKFSEIGTVISILFDEEGFQLKQGTGYPLNYDGTMPTANWRHEMIECLNDTGLRYVWLNESGWREVDPTELGSQKL